MQDDQKLTSGRRTSAPERMRRGPRSLLPAPAGEAGHGHDPCAGEDAALCRDTTYAGLVTAVRSAVERNAGFGA
ncbi:MULTISPECIES: hypothetical protein [unclassified Massilia]|uniref:hypothetical protein n=1 Tax=unclassified Massilia TaxID=2609279 RepID=UPI001B822826|nr:MULTISPECIES: hypothetical protein [unclassified Massilia]MBQ5941004.1 hypothetical protein [Massilia sp. AB1]MBQ5963794.1 hypothetical protein [Massilia sp. ZL223]